MKKWIIPLLLTLTICVGLFSISGSAALTEGVCTQNFTCNGTTYTLVLAMYNSDDGSMTGLNSVLWPVDVGAFDGHENQTPFGSFAVTIFTDYGQTGQAEVSETLRTQLISNVVFSGASNNTSDFIWKIDTSKNTGRWYASPYLRYIHGEAYLTAAVTLSGGCSAVNPLTVRIGSDVIPGDVTIDCASKGIDTQEKLNAALASLDKNYETDKCRGIYFVLGSLNYGDVVLNNQNIKCDVIFNGTDETKMSSLTVTGGKLGAVTGIDFSSSAAGKGSGLTYSAGGGWFALSDCKFSRYDKAVSLSGDFNPTIDGCLFTDCNTGIYLDCAGRTPSSTASVYECAFVGTSAVNTGVSFANVPANVIYYNYRIYHCEFYKNNISSAIGFTFSGNYFDANSTTAANTDLRFLSPTGLLGYLQGTAAKPDWKTIYMGISGGASTVTVSPDNDLFPSGLYLDGDAFNRNSKLTLDVSDGSSTVAAWDFN